MEWFFGEQEEICSPDPWVILHKIDSPTKMRYIGSKVASCNVSADAVGVAPSIAPWVKPKGVLEGKRLRARTVQCIHVLLMNFALHACVHA